MIGGPAKPGWRLRHALRMAAVWRRPQTAYGNWLRTIPTRFISSGPLWTLYGIGAADETFLTPQLRHANEHVRTWAVRLLIDAWPLDTPMSQRPAGRPDVCCPDALLAEFSRMAREDPSGLVRLALASALQRLPIAQRPALAAPLTAHAEEASDHNLPWLLWYGLIPVAETDPAALVKVAAACELPITRRFIARRLAAEITKTPGPLNALLDLAVAKPEPFKQISSQVWRTVSAAGARPRNRPHGKAWRPGWRPPPTPNSRTWCATSTCSSETAWHWIA